MENRIEDGSQKEEEEGGTEDRKTEGEKTESRMKDRIEDGKIEKRSEEDKNRRSYDATNSDHRNALCAVHSRAIEGSGQYGLLPCSGERICVVID